jgi:glycosyltransferase involved in cell wall biosynthesis
LRFSIIIPTYNRARFLKTTLDSILNQTFTDFEIIVVDDGSTDDTESVVSAFSSEKIKYFKKENEERGKARNFGFEKSNGEYINFFDSDDVMYKFHLASANESINKLSNPEVICFPFDYLDTSLSITGTRKGFNSKMNDQIYQKNCVHLNGTFIRKNVLNKENLFIEDPRFRVSEDWYFILNLALKRTVIGIQKPTSGYVIHNESTMSNFKSNDILIAWTYFQNLLNDNISSEQTKFSNLILDFFSMIALAYAIEGNRVKSFQYLLKICRVNPLALLSKRTLGTLKNYLHASKRV